MNAETMTDKPAPCPFCGCGPSDDEHAPQVQLYRGISAPEVYVWCEACGAEGPTRPTRAEALTAWNARTVQAELVEADVDWRIVARLAGEHGIRYRTNKALVQFLNAITRATGAAS